MRKIRRFAPHYVEMVVVMLAGMMVPYPAWMRFRGHAWAPTLTAPPTQRRRGSPRLG